MDDYDVSCVTTSNDKYEKRFILIRNINDIKGME